MPRLGRSRSEHALASIVYRSRASYRMEDADLLALLVRARDQNAVLAVTGVLVYDRGRFFQCIEGAEASLTTVMNRIRSDPRHDAIEILMYQGIPARLYPGWTMNLARRMAQPPLVMDGLLLVAADVLDGLHLDDHAVQIVLASLSVPAWAAR